MLRLLLMRHAKSSWDQPGLRDFDRPLADRGLEDAPKMGTFVKSCGYVPDLIISSPAKRARQTAELFSEAAGVPRDRLSWDEDLYFSSTDAYFSAIRQSGSSVKKLMLIGHNPLMEELLTELTIQNSASPFIFPTAAIACVEVNADSWKECAKGINDLKWFMIPKLISYQY